jgi:hypothetical protein
MANGKIVAAAALGVFTLVVPAMAQSAPEAPPAAAPAPAAVEKRAETETMERRARAEPTVTEEVVNELPKWESYGSGNDQDRLDETFFRLAQDFVSTAEVGVRRLGHVPIWPRGELKFGMVRILPYLRQAVEYETNLYKRNVTENNDDRRKGRQTGWTHVNQVGFLADTLLNGGRTRISGSVDSRWMVSSARRSGAASAARTSAAATPSRSRIRPGSSAATSAASSGWARTRTSSRGPA